jgi:polyhydroxyalkanoate synthesis regulator phasin
MTAENYIGYFAHMIDNGEMTEEEANRRLREMFEADMRNNELDRELINKFRCQSNFTEEEKLTKRKMLEENSKPIGVNIFDL